MSIISSYPKGYGSLQSDDNEKMYFHKMKKLNSLEWTEVDMFRNWPNNRETRDNGKRCDQSDTKTTTYISGFPELSGSSLLMSYFDKMSL